MRLGELSYFGDHIGCSFQCGKQYILFATCECIQWAWYIWGYNRMSLEDLKAQLALLP